MVFVAKDFNELTLTELYEIMRSRADVFLIEQNIVCQDLDGIDYNSRHCFIKDGDRVVAYLRVFECGDCLQIGRVITLEHGRGLGRELMQRSLDDIAAHFGNRRLLLHAQTYAAGFYEKFGFKITSDEFIEDGIPHIEMQKTVEVSL